MAEATPCSECRYFEHHTYSGGEYNTCAHPALEQTSWDGTLDPFAPPDGFGCVLGEARDGDPTG
jgi:hypothetical protein